jgi:hypothetical protein
MGVAQPTIATAICPWQTLAVHWGMGHAIADYCFSNSATGLDRTGADIRTDWNWRPRCLAQGTREWGGRAGRGSSVGSGGYILLYRGTLATSLALEGRFGRHRQAHHQSYLRVEVQFENWSRGGAAALNAVDYRHCQGLRGASGVLGTVRACWRGRSKPIGGVSGGKR